MGVRGLTTFIESHSRRYFDEYELHDTYLVMDGNCIACQLYRWHTKCHDSFGGDYDKIAHEVNNLFKMLLECGVTPLVVFDGAYEDRKMKTIYMRMKNKIQDARKVCPVSEGRDSVFPLFLRELFCDLLLHMGVKCVRCDFECDSDVAYLARSLNCPVLSYDSDFFITDAPYIPFSNLDLRVRTKAGVKFLNCEMYRVRNFLNYFGGMDKVNLPLLGVLLGNDYIKKKTFSKFYQQIKVQKGRENEQQRFIKGIIEWLKNETPESALRKILGRYKFHSRKRVAGKIQMAIQGYQGGESQICSYFGFDDKNQQKTIEVPKPEDIEDIADDSDEDSSSDEELIQEPLKACANLQIEPTQFFWENYRKCLYPACFMEMLVTNTYYCIPQIEDFSEKDHSHTISSEILQAIHKILLPSQAPLMVVARDEHSNIKKTTLPPYESELPQLAEIENMTNDETKSLLLNILKIKSTNYVGFPQSWQLFIVTLTYWVNNSKSKVPLPLVYAVLLCAVVLRFIDTKIGYCRSQKTFASKFGFNPSKDPPTCTFTDNIHAAVENLDTNNSVNCLRTLLPNFQMDPKMRGNPRLFDRKIIHKFAEFQSCILHVKYLNSLLKFPFSTILISDFYDGTFVYNITANLSRRTDLKGYIKILLKDSPQVLHILELIVKIIQKEISTEAVTHGQSKKRKRRRKSKDVIADVDMESVQSDEESFLDENNVYSLLNFVNK